MNRKQRALAERAIKEADAMNDIALPVYFNMITAQMLIANLQLALRHPRNQGNARKLAYEVIDGLIRQMAEVGAAANVEMAMLGNDPSNDVLIKHAGEPVQ
jgi:hypothetical protein